MKYLLLIVLLTGCTQVWYPKGMQGRSIPYYQGFEKKCYKCKQSTTLFKLSKKRNKVLCADCYEKYYK